MFIGILSFIIVISCKTKVSESTYAISFFPNTEIMNDTEYSIDSLKFKHSKRPNLDKKFLSATKVIYFENKGREFVVEIPNNLIAKQLYQKLNQNDNYDVWHIGGELTLKGKFYFKRKDGQKVIIKSINYSLPFDIGIQN